METIDINQKRILNLGAGVQSSTLALMGVQNWHYWGCSEPLPYPAVGLIQHAIFADTRGEPEAVYKHLKWLKAICEKFFPVHIVSKGDLAKDIKEGLNSTGQRFISIPAFTHSGIPGDQMSVTRRQCTKDYKVQVIEQFIRRELLGVAPGRPAPHGNGVVQLMGLSYDETARIISVKARYQSKRWDVEFPLWQMQMTRGGCKTWLKKWFPDRVVPRSACVFCPYHSNTEWRHIRDEDPEGWAEAIRIDYAIRDHDWTVTRDTLKQQMFLHKDCKPLDQVDLRDSDERSGQTGSWVPERM